ncbi:MAG: hypothetical protein ACRDT5_21920 [Mycobacterium sp.]
MTISSTFIAEVSEARSALRDLEQHNVKLPKAVTAAVAVLDRVQGSTPPEPQPNAVAEAIVNDAAREEVGRLLHTVASYQQHRQAVFVAAKIAAGRVLAEIRRAADELHQQLAVQAAELIGQMAAAAQIDVPLQSLVRAGRDADARVVVDADTNAARLTALYAIVAEHLYPRATWGVDNVDCRQWVDPRKVQHAPNVLAGLRAGGELHLARPDQAQAAAAPIAEAVARQHERDKHAIVSKYGVA